MYVYIHNVSQYSLSSGQFNKILYHIPWCLITGLFSSAIIKTFKSEYLEKLHFSLQLLLCYHSVRGALVINETN